MFIVRRCKKMAQQMVSVPKSLLRKMEKASAAFQAFEDELEDFLISQDTELLERLRRARQDHLSGNVRPFEEIRRTK